MEHSKGRGMARNNLYALMSGLKYAWFGMLATEESYVTFDYNKSC